MIFLNICNKQNAPAVANEPNQNIPYLKTFSPAVFCFQLTSRASI